jgi:hypothetical protein
MTKHQVELPHVPNDEIDPVFFDLDTPLDQSAIPQQESAPVIRDSIIQKAGAFLTRLVRPHSRNGAKTLPKYDGDTYTAMEYEYPSNPYAEVETSNEHYVKEAPRFLEQLEDTGRTNTFSYKVLGLSDALSVKDTPNAQIATMTEHEGLLGLNTFLDRLEENPRTAFLAKGMRENLTFIGKKSTMKPSRVLPKSGKIT